MRGWGLIYGLSYGWATRPRAAEESTILSLTKQSFSLISTEKRLRRVTYPLSSLEPGLVPNLSYFAINVPIRIYSTPRTHFDPQLFSISDTDAHRSALSTTFNSH